MMAYDNHINDIQYILIFTFIYINAKYMIFYILKIIKI